MSFNMDEWEPKTSLGKQVKDDIIFPHKKKG